MGLIMWFMMRGNKGQTSQEANQVPMSTHNEPLEVAEPPKRGSMLSMLFMCLNWKVVAGLAVVGLIVGIVAPRLLLGAIPLLILAACPISMLFMMRGMRGGHSSSQAMQMSQPQSEEVTHEEQIATLRAQLASTQAQLESFASDNAERERAGKRLRSEDEAGTYAVERRSGSQAVPKW